VELIRVRLMLRITRSDSLKKRRLTVYGVVTGVLSLVTSPLPVPLYEFLQSLSLMVRALPEIRTAKLQTRKPRTKIL